MLLRDLLGTASRILMSKWIGTGTASSGHQYHTNAGLPEMDPLTPFHLAGLERRVRRTLSTGELKEAPPPNR